MKKEQLFRILTVILIIFIPACVMFAASLATSPLYPHNYSYDSAFFRFIGTEILKGKTLYKDVWDNKGPLLYFIQALGALFGTANKGRNLLFLMQLISVWISAFFMYKTQRLSQTSKLADLRFLGSMIVVMSVFSMTMESGNLSEEWCMPLTCCSFYLLSKFAINAQKRPEHPAKYAFLHGICLGAEAMIRINNAFPICAGLAVTGLWLIWKRQWKNLMQNILAGLAGIICVLLPIMGWAYVRGALGEMIYAVFTYNLQYVQVRSFIPYRGEAFITRYLPLAAAGFILLLYWIRTRSVSLSELITAAIFGTAVWMLADTNVYLHYFTMFIPVLFLILIHCSGETGIPETAVLALLLVWFGWQNIQRIPGLVSLHRQGPLFTAAARIPEEERESVIAVNLPPEIYLNYKLEPVSRFCAYQYVHFAIDTGMKDEFMETLYTTPPAWILAFCSGETKIPEVQQLIDSSYEYSFDQSDVCYYHLNKSFQ